MSPSDSDFLKIEKVLFYLKYVAFEFAILLTIPQIIKIYRKDLKFYQGPLVFLFFSLAEYLVSLGLVIFYSSIYPVLTVSPGLFYSTTILLFVLIIIILFIDPETPKKYSFIALGVFLGLSLLVFLFPLMTENLNTIINLIQIFCLIYSSGSIECTVLALINKKHDIIPIFIYIPLIIHNIFGLVIYFLEYSYYKYPFFSFYSITYPFYIGTSCIIIQMIIFCVLRVKRVQQNVIQPVVGYVPPQQNTITQATGNVYYQQPFVSQQIQPLFNPYDQPQQTYYQNVQPIVNSNYPLNNDPPMNNQPTPENSKPAPENQTGPEKTTEA